MASSQHNDNWTKEYFINCGFHWSKGEKYIFLGGKAGFVKRDFLAIFDHIFWGQCTKKDPEGFFEVGQWYDVAVQCTSKGHKSTRMKKMLNAKTFPWWTEHPHKRSFLQCWEKKGSYTLEEFTMDDWNAYQKELNEKNDTIDTSGPLYRELIFGEKKDS